MLGTGLATRSGAVRAAIASCQAFLLPDVGDELTLSQENHLLYKRLRATTVFAAKIGELADLLCNCKSPER